MSFTSQLQNRLKEYILAEEENVKEDLLNNILMILPGPQFVADCDFIPKENRIKREAWTVSDAFEAVTNGMFSPELSKQLDEIPEGSLFYPWVILTKGVKAFYAGDISRCSCLLSSLPENTAPSRYREFFTALEENRELPEDWQKLGDAVLEDQTELSSSLEQLREAASAGMEDLLLETAEMIIRDIRKDHPETASKILVWTFHQLQEIDVLSDKAAEKAQQLFGEAEGLRLTALATLAYDQDRSLIFWLLALRKFLKSSHTSRADVRAYLRIIRDIAETVALEFELTDEYLHLLTTHMESLIASLDHLYPDLTSSLTDRNPDNLPAVIPLLKKLAGEEKKSLSPLHKKTIQSNAAPVQLELFAF